MRHALWLGPLQEHLADIDKYFSKAEIDIVEVFVLERSNGVLGGFIELNVRNYAEGSQSSQVPYVEGWYVDSDLRGRGYGRQLIRAAEMWATGVVSSTDTFVVYSGAVLTDGATYFVRVRVNNGTLWGDWLPLKFRERP